MDRSEPEDRVGILGGTFDPIHNGHVCLAKSARDRFGLKKVMFIPARRPPHKQAIKITAGRIRLEMVERAVADLPGFEASDIELSNPGLSYSVKTLRKLKREYPKTEFFFIVGSDAVPELDTWKDAEELFRLSRFVIACRPGWGKLPLPPNAELLEDDFPAISSSELRNLIRQGRTVDKFIPTGVIDVINKYRLYQP